jgi:hypothetical protein
VALNSFISDPAGGGIAPQVMPSVTAHEMAAHELAHVRLGHELRACVAFEPGGPDGVDHAGVDRGAVVADRAPAGVRQAASTAIRSWISSREPHPTVVDLAHHVAEGHHHVVEELLAELERAVHLADLLDRDAGLMDLQDEHGEAAVLGHIPVGAGEAHRVVARERGRTPDFGAVQPELVAVAIRSGETASQIGPARGLGQELHPQLLATQDRRQVARLLFVRAELDQRGGEDAERRHVERERHVVGRRLLRAR